MRLLIATTAALALAAVVTAGTAATKNKVLRGTVGPGFTITVKNPAGAIVKTTKAGTYDFVIRDRSASHNFRLTGPGINKRLTGIAFRGTKTVTVKLKVGRYIYLCEPHSLDMKSSFKVTA
jgi:plastocyanin